MGGGGGGGGGLRKTIPAQVILSGLPGKEGGGGVRERGQKNEY